MAITKEASDIYSNNLPVFYTPSARLAFSEIVSQIGFKSNEALLLPSYIGITDTEGSGVFDPVRNSKVKYDFYKVNGQLELDYSDIKKKIALGKIRAILVIHYFGFFQKDTIKLRKLCDENNIILIEDCAHAMDSFYKPGKMKPIGKIGDYAFYSIHKYLPTKDGGFYTYKSNGNKWIRKYPAPPIPFEVLYQVSVADYNTIRKKRIDNYKKMLGLLKPSKNYDVMFPSIGKDTVPIAFPVLIHGNKREQVYFKLIDKKVSVFALYYRMIEQISKEKFPVSYSISNSILHFPIHQDITKDDLVYMAKTFNKIINER